MDVGERAVPQNDGNLGLSEPSIGRDISRASTEPPHPEVQMLITKAEWTKIQKDISGLREDNKHQSERYDRLLEDFEECKTELLKWQAPVQTSDDSIQKGLERIHRAIDGWVYDLMVDIPDNSLYEFCLKEHRNLQRQKQCSKFEEFIKNSAINAWGPYLCSNFLILSLIIQWILDEHIFHERYPLTITQTHIQALRDVEDAMRSSSQSRGPLSIERWRSETLRALTVSPKSEAYRAQVLKAIWSQTRDILSRWTLNGCVFARLEEQFQRGILEPAIRLHQEMRVSTYRYRMDQDDVPKELSFQQMLDQWKLIDVDTWGPVRKGAEALRILYCLHPPLIRFRNSNGVSIVLSKPVMVVAYADKQAQIHRRGEDDLPPATSESKSHEVKGIMKTAKQTIREEEAAEASSVSGNSDLEYARRMGRSKKRGGRHQSSDKGLLSHDSNYSEARLSSPDKATGGHRTLSPDSYTHVVPRDTTKQRRKSRSWTSGEQEHSLKQSSRTLVADGEASDHHIPIVRPYILEERRPEESTTMTAYSRSADRGTSPSNDRRSSAAKVRYPRADASRSRDKRMSLLPSERETALPSSPSVTVPPARNAGIWSTLGQNISTLGGVWHNPPPPKP